MLYVCTDPVILCTVVVLVVKVCIVDEITTFFPTLLTTGVLTHKSAAVYMSTCTCTCTCTCVVARAYTYRLQRRRGRIHLLYIFVRNYIFPLEITKFNQHAVERHYS